jgi:hypothetical protein
VCTATIIAILFGREHAVEWQSLGRLFIIGALSWLAWRGRRWAVVALGVVVIAAAAGLVLGAVQAGLTSLWGTLFVGDALLFAAGYGVFLSGCRKQQPEPPR